MTNDNYKWMLRTFWIIAIPAILFSIFGCEQNTKANLDKRIDIHKLSEVWTKAIDSIVPYKGIGINKASIYYDLDWETTLFNDRKILRYESRRSNYKIVKVDDAYQIRFFRRDGYYNYWTYFTKKKAVDALEEKILAKRVSYNTIVYRINQLNK